VAAGSTRTTWAVRGTARVAVLGAGLLLLSLAACGPGGTQTGAAEATGATVAAGAAGATSAGTAGPMFDGQSAASSTPGRAPSPSSSAPSAGAPASAPGTSTPAGTPVHADPLAGAAGYLAQRDGTVLAAVYDVRTGQTWRLGDGPPQAEASVVKLDILQALLAEWPGGLPADEQSLAARMIEDSDNDAATSLWYAAGGPSGVSAYNARAGLTQTTPSSCVVCTGFAWPGWGLTTTIPADQLALLKELVEPGPLLTPDARQYALSLLENVAPDQAWGVSGGVPAGVTVALKDGWLPLNGDQTDWQINSVGWVSGDGRDYLIAVLSTGNPNEQYGIDTISGLSALVWQGMG
jgi:Beta-lactamase enzyme family